MASVTELAEKDRERTAMLLVGYELADGNAGALNISVSDLMRRLDLTYEHASRTLRWLADRDLMAQRTMGGPGSRVEITARGVDAAEEILRDGGKVPLSVLVLDAEEQIAVERFLTIYRRGEETGEHSALDRDPDVRAEVDADIATVESQQRSPRPKRRIIRYALTDLHALMIGVAGSATYVELEKAVQLLA